MTASHELRGIAADGTETPLAEDGFRVPLADGVVAELLFRPRSEAILEIEVAWRLGSGSSGPALSMFPMAGNQLRFHFAGATPSPFSVEVGGKSVPFRRFRRAVPGGTLGLHVDALESGGIIVGLMTSVPSAPVFGTPMTLPSMMLEVRAANVVSVAIRARTGTPIG